MPLSISIIINTLNRGHLIGKTIDSFRWLKYNGDFEVVIVNGPSTDNTDEVLAFWGDKIRTGRCDVANLSVSRNIGICIANGDLVAFIDDDAIPEPEWLTQLSAAYDSDEIGATGGFVYDQSGYNYQYQYSTANRLGNTNWELTKSSEHLCFPGSFEFPYLQGTNASFRRSTLLEVGGFDEEIEYSLDETELCCRIVDAGYVVRQLNNAFVHHKLAPSHLRDEKKITRFRYPALKNKIYFSLKHARSYLSIPEILEDGRLFTVSQANDVESHIAAGRIPASERDRFIEESKKAWERGIERGLSDFRHLITGEKQMLHHGVFTKFEPLTGGPTKSIVLVSRDYPPNHRGGIATFSKALAEALAQEGNIVHLITESSDINRVDFENGVWVHRMLVREIKKTEEALQRCIPPHIWNWSAVALEEAKRISRFRPIDIVEAPIWDCEGVAFLLDGDWPLITSLHTTLHFWIKSFPEYGNNKGWMDLFGNPMLALERALMTKACGIRANSGAIIHEIEKAYDFSFNQNGLKVIPHGIEERAMRPLPMDKTNECVEILFVGRLEERKGIDVLLNAIPLVVKIVPDARFRIIGDNSIAGPDGLTYKKKFLDEYQNNDWLRNIIFEGRVSEEELYRAYACCDIFVAPSRFESFGLVFLEAMREGKPVIGCNAGGMPEIITNEKNGLLVPPGDEILLVEAMLHLIQDQQLRRSMGEAGRKTFQEKFTAKLMAKESNILYQEVIKKFNINHDLR